MGTMRWTGWVGLGLVAVLLGACSSGPVRRVSEPSARIQQLKVNTDGSWSTELRVENFSSIPMRVDSLQLELKVEDHVAATLQASPALLVGPESADLVTINLSPTAAAKFAVANALAEGRSVDYALRGTLTATPDQERQRVFQIERSSALSPAPGLPGVMR